MVPVIAKRLSTKFMECTNMGDDTTSYCILKYKAIGGRKKLELFSPEILIADILKQKKMDFF